MMKWINILLAVCFACLLGSCAKEDTDRFEGDAALYFFRGDNGQGQQDSMVYSFFLVSEGQRRDTVLVDVRTMGFPVDYERPVRIVQTNAGEPGAAEAGKHYVAFDDASLKDAMCIPANKAEVKIPVVVLYDASLDREKVRLEMAIVENEYFRPGIDQNRNFMVSITALAEMPDTWKTTWKYYFGEWGTQKMGFIVNYLGFSEFEKTDQESGYKQYLSMKAIEKLDEYNAAHPEYPLCEDKGKLHPGGVACEHCVEF